MAFALQQRLFLFLLFGLLYAAQPLLAHSHGHEAHGRAHFLAQNHDVRRNVSAPAGNFSSSAEDIIARFHLAMAVANEAIIISPKQNSPQAVNSTTARPVEARPLDYSGHFQQHANGTVYRRGASHGNGTVPTNSTRQSYTVPAEVVEAARMLAEANPLPAVDYDALLSDVRARLARRNAHVNNTNMMPQKTQRASGLVQYVSPDELAITVQNGTQVAGPLHPDQGPMNHTRGADAAAAAVGGSTNLAKRDTKTFWMETMTQRGSAPYAGPDYKVWRNVKDYGAVGDGIADDTAAINRAISAGGRCGAGCPSSTRFPATVYFPAGTYLVSSPIIQFYNTEMLGDPFNQPVIRAAGSFVGLGVITSDVYTGADVTWYLNQNNFLRSVRNFVIDIRSTNQAAFVCGIHWQVAQGTSLENIAFLSTKPSDNEVTTQQGIYMENGSGGFMSNLIFVGGNFGAYFGNQQFTTSGLLFDSCRTGLQIHWDWGWTMQDTEYYNCRKGIVIVGGAGGPFSTGQGVGSLSLVDVHMWGVPVAVETSLFADNSTALYISNGGFQNCDNIVIDSHANRVLYPGNAAGLTNVLSWGFGKVADPSGETGFKDGADVQAPDAYPASLLVSDAIHPRAKFFHRKRPSYADPGNSQIFDVKEYGAKGDGSADDTAALNHILDVAANVSGIVYFPHGVYVITDTLEVPVGSRVIGQAWPQIMAMGDKFHDMTNPRAAVRVGAVGSVGVMEIQCMMFTVRGPTAGAVLVEWNVHESSQGSAGLWDSHMRVGGAMGSNLQKSDCPKTAQNSGCVAASMLMHMTEKSSGYLENVWMWVADHDMEDADQIQINVFAARGILIESRGPTWLWGTAAEHAVLYQYQLSGAQNVVMGLIQTEAPYFQPQPKAPGPFERGLVFRDDPTFANCPADSATCNMAWSLRIIESTNIYVVSAGLYTWFQAYSQHCVNSGANDCQLSTFYVEQSFNVWVYNLVTIGTVQMAEPLNGRPVIARNNRNGFASSLVTWLAGANHKVGARNITGYTLYTRDDLASETFLEQCKTALTATITCPDLMMQWTSPAYRGSLHNATLQHNVCDVGCRDSLASWYKGVVASCAAYTWSTGAPLEMAGGYAWYGYNESCQVDARSGQYCNDVIEAFTDTETLPKMPDSELCSACFSGRVRMMQQSTYSIFNTVPWYQQALQAIQTRCKVQSPTDVPPPLIEIPKPKPFCVSNNYYTVKAGDTCNSIALANSVSSANVFYAASAAAPRPVTGCNALPADLNFCLPLTCKTYLVKTNDNCLSASASAGIDDVIKFNTWIDPSCDNLHEANATLGSVICASPIGSTYIPGTATNTSQIPGGGTHNYSSVVVGPPSGVSVAAGTSMDCGRWYVAQRSDTCGSITMAYSIALSIFAAANPSINAGLLGDCSASITLGYAYCVSPVYNPYDPNHTLPAASISDQAIVDNFDDHKLDNWKTADGKFDVSSGELVIAETNSAKAVYNATYRNLIVEADITITKSGGNGGLVFRASNLGTGENIYQGYYVGLSPDSVIYLGRANNGWTGLQDAQFANTVGQKYHIKVRAVNSLIKVYVNDMITPKLTQIDATYAVGQAGVRVWHTGMRVDNFNVQPLQDGFDNFDDHQLVGWRLADGSFDASSGELVIAETNSAKAVYDASFDNFVLEADIIITKSGGNGGLIFRASNLGIGENIYQGYYVGLNPDGIIYLGRANNGWTGLQDAPFAVVLGQKYHVKVHAVNNLIEVYVDDMATPKIIQKDATYTEGRAGVRVWHTGMRVDNFNVQSSRDFFDDFDDHKMVGWKTADGSFDPSSGELVIAETNSAKAVYDATFNNNFTVEADIAITKSGGNGGLIFRASNLGIGENIYQGYYVGLNPDGIIYLGRANNGWTGIQDAPFAVVLGQKYHVRVRVTDDLIEVFVDDMNASKISVRDGTYTQGSAGVRVWHTGMRVDNFRITA